MTFFSEQPVTTADKTFFQLRKAIVEGEVLQGSKLSETELSTKYAVSRAVVREAINRLEASHLVERKANVGARVVSLTAEGLLELYQVRESLEGMAARLAAINMSDQEISDLQDLLNSHFNEVRSGQSYYQEAGDVDFHYRIILGSKNKHLISMLLDGIYHLVRMYRVQLGMSGPRVTTAFDEHKHIVQAICNRDAELAEMLMRRHILYSKNSIENKLLEINS
ncbi:GntR family transcriptional regulator [Shewanella schlegeliana]|uniref:GntR family transcriptional regulator n=1 Tax=Shewanella schlegeliana TaxID=190308 RepID=A0ABS1SVX7_9GAMM|nr:GntR family transcriptional regulator [Shewanella schlegeliana]MBL4912064.1 GntR family transcriptional regulator [Shewanella schlegeliana]MCL1111339.1 GntR family transcriptional regulator [Shewanella schlegeliana]GIU33077.1 GntR family transcriptional regulator [Shewanella schlegeliana]